MLKWVRKVKSKSSYILDIYLCDSGCILNVDCRLHKKLLMTFEERAAHRENLFYLQRRLFEKHIKLNDVQLSLFVLVTYKSTRKIRILSVLFLFVVIQHELIRQGHLLSNV